MKCPYCEKLISSVYVRSIDGKLSLGKPWKCVAYGCPHCQKVISVGMDPKAFRNETVTDTVKKLQDANDTMTPGHQA